MIRFSLPFHPLIIRPPFDTPPLLRLLIPLSLSLSLFPCTSGHWSAEQLVRPHGRLLRLPRAAPSPLDLDHPRALPHHQQSGRGGGDHGQQPPVCGHSRCSDTYTKKPHTSTNPPTHQPINPCTHAPCLVFTLSLIRSHLHFCSYHPLPSLLSISYLNPSLLPLYQPPLLNCPPYPSL